MLLKSCVLILSFAAVALAQCNCGTLKSCFDQQRQSHQPCEQGCVQKAPAAAQGCLTTKMSAEASISGLRRFARQPGGGGGGPGGASGGGGWGHGGQRGPHHELPEMADYRTCSEGCRGGGGQGGGGGGCMQQAGCQGSDMRQCFSGHEAEREQHKQVEQAYCNCIKTSLNHPELNCEGHHMGGGGGGGGH